MIHNFIIKEIVLSFEVFCTKLLVKSNVLKTGTHTKKWFTYNKSLKWLKTSNNVYPSAVFIYVNKTVELKMKKQIYLTRGRDM